VFRNGLQWIEWRWNRRKGKNITMPKESEIQDIDEMARQIDQALAEARQTLDNLPAKVEGLEERTSALPALLEELLLEMEESGEIRDVNVQEQTQEPDLPLHS